MNFFLGSETRKGEMGRTDQQQCLSMNPAELCLCLDTNRQERSLIWPVWVLMVGQQGPPQHPIESTPIYWENRRLELPPLRKARQKSECVTCCDTPQRRQAPLKGGLEWHGWGDKTQIKGTLSIVPAAQDNPEMTWGHSQWAQWIKKQITWKLLCTFWHALSPQERQEPLPDETCMLNTSRDFQFSLQHI